ncbi:MAG TPA: LysR family transcriptional regulator [Pedomonas sp.]|uniref:LysR family transcriptional regulator n=1 Tax=Pedomonas sp. TaxID=2976421 RepID=UPI002F422046
MDLRQLLYFTTLAETLNFHRAAERLHISQPPLTVAIRKLEEELGAPLFVRGPRGVSLTAAGEAALEAARATLSHADHVRHAVREGSLGERGRLQVGFVGSATYELLPKLIPLFRRRYPNVDLVLEEGASIDIVRKIRSHQLDVGIVRLPLLELTQLDTQVIEMDELVVAVPMSSPLAQRRSLPLSQLAAEPFILFTRISVMHAIILMACHNAGFVPKVAQEAAQVHTIMSLVQSGLGVALMPSKATRYVPEGVKLLRLADPIRIETGVALSRETASPFALNFQALALEKADLRNVSQG